MKRTVGIWSFASSPTQFVPTGLQPQWADETISDRVRRVVDQVGDLIDGVEFHHPGEIASTNVDAVLDALDGRDIWCIATSLHTDRMFARGGMSSSDQAVRNEAVNRTLRGIELAGSVNANYILWPGMEGFDHPFQQDHADRWSYLVDSIARCAEHAATYAVRIFIEPKSRGPRARTMLRDIGTTLWLIEHLRTMGLTNVEVVMDWTNQIATGECLAERAALLSHTNALGHMHANAGWGGDEYNVVGSTAFMETLELAMQLQRTGYAERGGRICFDLNAGADDAVAAVRQSIENWIAIDDLALRIDGDEMRDAQAGGEALNTLKLLFTGLSASTAPRH